jgi:hypothetical protein
MVSAKKSRKAFVAKKSLGERMNDNLINKAQRRSTSRQRDRSDGWT